MIVFRRLLGALIVFVGAFVFVASATAAGMVVVHNIALEHRMSTVFNQRLETHYINSFELWFALSLAAIAGAVYGLGRMLLHGALSFWGRLLTSFGVLWWLLTGLCYATLFGAETHGAVFAGAFLIMSVGTLAVAIGQTLRPSPEADVGAFQPPPKEFT
jgi:hypothetical protein